MKNHVALFFRNERGCRTRLKIRFAGNDNVKLFRSMRMSGIECFGAKDEQAQHDVIALKASGWTYAFASRKPR